MTREELILSIEKIDKEKEKLNKEKERLIRQKYDLKDKFCKENSPFKVGDNIEINGIIGVIDCVELDSDYEFVCGFYYANNKEKHNAISEKYFNKIKKVSGK